MAKTNKNSSAKRKSNPKYQLHPTQLNKKSRAKHVVRALLDYNKGIIKCNPAGANAKFEKLLLSPFVFLRGTADLMYQDLSGSDADMATVLCMGDVHPENFGVMETGDGELLWGLNDFDEAAFAPFSWDVKRGATSVVLAAKDRGFSAGKRRKLATTFTSAYLDAIREFMSSDKEARPAFTRSKGPKMIRKLIKEAEAEDADKWLKKKYLDRKKGGFKKTDEIVPLRSNKDKPSTVAVFQTMMDAYVDLLAKLQKDPPTKIKVQDVATKTGSGTGSIGLYRYYALVKAKRKGHREKLILEVKHERPSVLEPYVGDGPISFPSEGARVVFSEEVQLANANPYYGYGDLNGESYLIRERSPHKARVDLETLTDFKDFRQYTEACGKALAYSHARSDVAFDEGEHIAEQRILQSINQDTFARDIGQFAARMASQVAKDRRSFKKAHSKGKFTFKEKKEKKK